MATSARRTPASKAAHRDPADLLACAAAGSRRPRLRTRRGLRGAGDRRHPRLSARRGPEPRGHRRARRRLRPGHAAGGDFAVAVRRAAPGARDRRREVLRRLPGRGGRRTWRCPQEGATVILRHTGATVRGKKLLDAIRAGEGGGVEIACPAIKRDSDRFDFAAGRVPDRPQADRPRRAAHARLGVRRRSDRTRRRVPAAHLRRAGRRHRTGRRAVLRRPRRDFGLHGRRHGDRGPLRRGARSHCATRWRPEPTRFRSSRRSRSKLRTMARVAGNRESSAALAARLGLKDWQVDRARRDLSGWSESTLGMAIQAAARADAEVKGGSRDRCSRSSDSSPSSRPERPSVPE